MESGIIFTGVKLGENADRVEPEQLRLEDDRIGFAVPKKDGVEIMDTQVWKCLRCGHEVKRPVYEGKQPHPPEYCKNCESKRAFKLVEPRAVIEPEWSPPSDVEPCPPKELYESVREYIFKHVNVDRECLYDGLAVWSLATWHKEAFPSVSHLCILAPTTSGKTRLCRTLSEVSYRGYNAGGSSESSLFRSIDGHSVTPFVSEFTGLPKETKRQIHNIIRVSQKKGEPIARSVRRGDQWVVRSFDTFTPMAVASQYDFPDDIKNRSIILKMHHDAGGIEPILREAGDLTEKLLFFRFSTRVDVEDGFEPVVSELYDEGIRGRLLEQLAPLITVARVCDVDLNDFVEWEKKKHKAVIKEQAHVQICEILSERIKSGANLDVASVVQDFNERTEADWSAQKMGLRLKDLGIDREMGSKGRKEVVVDSAVEAIELHGSAFGVEVPEVQEKIE